MEKKKECFAEHYDAKHPLIHHTINISTNNSYGSEIQGIAMDWLLGILVNITAYVSPSQTERQMQKPSC